MRSPPCFCGGPNVTTPGPEDNDRRGPVGTVGDGHPLDYPHLVRRDPSESADPDRTVTVRVKNYEGTEDVDVVVVGRVKGRSFSIRLKSRHEGGSGGRYGPN